MILKFVKKTREVGNAIIITIPTDVLEIGKIKAGDTLQVSIVTLNKEVNTTPIKENYVIPITLKKAVVESLILMQPDKSERERQSEENKAKKRDPRNKVNSTDLDFWTSSKEIKEYIKDNNLCDLELLDNKNIYSDIGAVLLDLGFIEGKRTASGTERHIKVNKLKALKGV
jgi:hypothetical protein